MHHYSNRWYHNGYHMFTYIKHFWWILLVSVVVSGQPTPVPYAVNGYGKVPTVFVNTQISETPTPTPTSTPIATPTPTPPSKVTDGLVLEFPLDEGTGLVLNEIINDLDITANVSITWVTGGYSGISGMVANTTFDWMSAIPDGNYTEVMIAYQTKSNMPACNTTGTGNKLFSTGRDTSYNNINYMFAYRYATYSHTCGTNKCCRGWVSAYPSGAGTWGLSEDTKVASSTWYIQKATGKIKTSTHYSELGFHPFEAENGWTIGYIMVYTKALSPTERTTNDTYIRYKMLLKGVTIP